MSDYQQEQLDYKNFILQRPHVFILGAGATIAAIPNGDKNGRKSSVMNEFIDNIGARDLFKKYNLDIQGGNLEDIYSEIHDKPELKVLTQELENRIIEYFSSLEIPDSPTNYDYLLLSLRSKDYIFSFNWDDLLIQAYRRVYKITKNLPKLGFLHGNINLGRCINCGSIESYCNLSCRKCGGKLMRPQILFPVKEKDYTQDPYIKNCWEAFLEILSQATIVTIFGYSAPKSDINAMKAMGKAFSTTFRRLDQIEVIDIKEEAELYEIWAPFIEPTNYHFKVRKTLFESFIAEFPRRSIEGYWERYFNNWWGYSKIQFSENLSFKQLTDLTKPILEKEEKDEYGIFM